MRRFAERFDLPVACSFRRQTSSTTTTRLCGRAGVAPSGPRRPLQGGDLVVLVGGRMSEMPRPATASSVFPSRRRLVHVHPGAEARPRLPPRSPSMQPTAFVAALEGLQPPNAIAWGRRRAPRARLRRWSTPLVNPGPVQMSEIVAAPPPPPDTPSSPTGRATIPAGSTASSATAATARSSGPRPHTWAAAIAAAPPPSVVAFAGDGCFQMTSQRWRPPSRPALRSSSWSSTTASTAPSACTRARLSRSRHRHRHRDRISRCRPAHGGHGETVARTETRRRLRERGRFGEAGDHRGEARPEAITPTRTMSEIRGSTEVDRPVTVPHRRPWTAGDGAFVRIHVMIAVGEQLRLSRGARGFRGCPCQP